MNYKGRIIIHLFLLPILLLLLTNCVDRKEILYIGLIAPSTNHLPLLIAGEEDLMNNDRMKIHHFTSGWEANEALINGRIDVAIMPFTYAWQGVSENRGIRIISFLERESDGIIARAEINSLEELDGKRVGVLRASTLDIFFHMVIDEYGIEPDIVYFRTPTEMATALTSKHVDALSFYVPSIFQFDERFKVIFWYSELYPEHPCCDIIANEKSLSTKGDLVSGFMEIISEGARIIDTERDRGVKAIEKNFGYDLEIAAKTLEQQKFIYGLEIEGVLFQQEVAAKMLELGYMRKMVEPGEVYYDIFEVE